MTPAVTVQLSFKSMPRAARAPVVVASLKSFSTTSSLRTVMSAAAASKAGSDRPARTLSFLKV